MNKVAIYGSGGHSRVVREILVACGFEVAETYDDHPERRHFASKDVKPGLRLVGLENFEQPELPILIAIGNNVERSELSRMLQTSFVTAIHPTATISPTAAIGEGTVIHHDSVVQANTRIGRHVLINTAASIDHDNTIGDFAHISPQVALSGHVEVGEGTHVGIGACVTPSVKIGKWCKIGAGAVIIKDVPDYSTVVGNPGRVIKCQVPQGVEVELPSTEFDVAFIGSGVSTSFTILRLLDGLKPDDKTLRIAVIEKDREFHTGIPYGQRSQNSLLISPLDDFLPTQERQTFLDWLTINKSWVFEEFRAEAGALSNEWLEDNAALIDNDNWGPLYLPRTIFGRWIRERMHYAMESARVKGLIEYQLINDEALNTTPCDDGYELQLGDGTIQAEQVVLAVGGPTVTPRLNTGTPDVNNCLIEDPYFPSQTEVLNRIRGCIAKRDRKIRILVIGANASAIEMIYRLNDKPEFDDHIAQYIVLSPRGQLPHRMGAKSIDDLPLPNLTALGDKCELDQSALKAHAILDNASADINLLEESGYSMAQTLSPVLQAVMGLVNRLSPAEKLNWANHGGNALGRLQRRAGPAYLDAIVGLQVTGRLELVAGSFESVKCDGDEGYLVEADPGTGELPDDMAELFDVIVNCAGGASVVGEGSPPLLSTMVDNKVIGLTPSGQGIEVNDNFEAAEKLFVMGPFLSGNMVRDKPIWHMEHAGRIGNLAAELATEILAGIKSPSNR